MGEPQKPTPGQYAEMEAAGKLAELGPATETEVKDHAVSLDFSLPRTGRFAAHLQVRVSPAISVNAESKENGYFPNHESRDSCGD